MVFSPHDLFRCFIHGEDRFQSGDEFTLTRTEYDDWFHDRKSLFVYHDQYPRARPGDTLTTVKYKCNYYRAMSKKQKRQDPGKPKGKKGGKKRSSTAASLQTAAFVPSSAVPLQETMPPQETSPSKWRAQALRVGHDCKVYFLARFKADNTVEIKWHHQHNHAMDRPYTVVKDRHLSPAMIGWLRTQVEQKMGTDEIMELLAVGEEDYEEWKSQGYIPEAALVTPKHVQRLVRQFISDACRLNKDLWLSMLEYVTRVRQDGGFGIANRNVPTPTAVKPTAWMVAVSTPWQLNLLRQAPSTLSLDSTHSTCVAFEGDDVYLYSIVVRSPTTGGGVPVAFMLTNSMAAPPITLWLQSMRDELPLLPVTVVIDCSATEADAILSTWPHASIIYCWFHVFQAVERARRKYLLLSDVPKDKRKKLRDDAFDLFCDVLSKPKDKAAFEAAWEAYRTTYAAPSFQRWTDYLQHTWINSQAVQQRSAAYGRCHDHQGIDTNNFIESWHNTLKKKYVGSVTRERADHLLWNLLNKALPDFSRKKLQTELGVVRPTLTEAEKEGRRKAEAIPPVRASQMVSREEGVIRVCSFTEEDVVYVLQTQRDMDEHKLLCSGCSCPSFARASIQCKHMFLASRALGEALFFVRTGAGGAASTVEVRQPACPQEVLEEANKRKALTQRGYQEEIAAALLWLSKIPCNQTSQKTHKALSMLARELRLAAMNAASR